MSNGFEYTIEIRDKFARALEEFRQLAANAAKETAKLDKQLKTLEKSSEEATKALGGSVNNTKAAAKANEDLAAAIGKASSAQRKKMTADQRVEDTLAKKAERFTEQSKVEAIAAERGIDLRRKKIVAIKEEMSLEDKINNILSKRAGIRETRTELRRQGFDPRGDRTADRVDEIIAGRAEKRDTDAGLRQRGFDPKGDTALHRANEIIERQNELLATNEELRKRGFDAKGVAIVSREASIEARVNEIIDRQNSLREVNLGLARRGFDAKGVAIVSREAEIQNTINEIITRQNRIREINAGLKERGFDTKGNPLAKEVSVQERATQIIERQNKALELNRALKDRGFDPRGNRIQTNQELGADKVARELRRLEIKQAYQAAERATPAISRLRREVGETATAGNRISFTFRRLFGIFAAFTAVRVFVGQLKEAVASSVRFNAEIETSALGIASLITATGKVETATGKLASTTEGWAIAQQEAQRQLKLLRKDALTTAATFPELTKAFQTAIGPGLTAGLNLDEIRQFASSISKAASAIGVEQIALAEEIRALLTGSISVRNTRIATALGITNADVNRAKEMGVLFEFLDGKLTSFNRASKEGAQTFTVLLSNAKDAVGNLLGVSFTGFFEKLKELLTLVNTSIVDAATADINPRLISVFETIGMVLETAADEAKEIITTLSTTGAENTFLLIATILETAVILVSDLIQGLLKASAIVGTILSPVLLVVRTIGNLLGPSINQILIWSVALVAAFNLLRLSTVGLYTYLVRSTAQLATMVGLSALLNRNLVAGAAIGPLTRASTIWGVIAGYVSTVGTFLATWAGRLSIVVAGIGAAYYILKDFKDTLQEITGLTGSWGTVLKTVVFSFLARLNAIKRTVFDVFDTGVARLKVGLTELVAVTAEQLAKVLRLIPSSTPVAGKLASAAVKQLDLLATGFRNVQAAAEASLESRGTLFDQVKENFQEANAATLAYYKTVTSNESKTGTLGEAISKVPATVQPNGGATSAEITTMAEDAKKLKDEIDGANAELSITLATLRAQGVVQQQLKLLAEGQAKVAKEGRFYDTKKNIAQGDFLAAQRDLLDTQTTIGKKSKEEQATVFGTLAAIRDIADLSSKVAEASDARDIAALARTKGTGSDAQVEQAEKEFEAAKATLAAAQDRKAPAKELFDLAVALNVAENKSVSAQKRINEAVKARRDLDTRGLALYETKIATIAAAEFEQSKLRQAETEMQITAAQRLLGVARSRVSDDAQLAQADNAVDAEDRKLRLLAEQNKANQDAVKYIIAQTRNTQIRIGLQEYLVRLTQENATAEELAAIESQTAQESRYKIIEDIAEARADAIRAVHDENRDLQTQIDLAEGILEVRKKGTSFDEQVAESRSRIAAAEAKSKSESLAFVERERKLQADLLSTQDPGAIAHLEGLITVERTKSLKTLILQAVVIATMREELEDLIRTERQRSDQLRSDTRASRLLFNAEQGTDREATNILRQSLELGKQQLILRQLLETQKASTAEIEAQVEEIRQASIEYDKLIRQASNPLGEGFLEGARQFLRDVPTAFETAVEFTQAAFEGLSQTLADSFTAAFDPRNTQTVEERFGELLLSLGNLLIKHVLDNLIAGLVSQFFPALAEGVASATAQQAAGSAAGAAAGAAGVGAGGIGAGALGGVASAVGPTAEITAAGAAAAASITTAGGSVTAALGGTAGAITAGTIPLEIALQALTAAIQAAAIKANVSAVTTPVGYHGGLVRSYRKGGRIGRGSIERHPEDNIPALLRAGEYVLTPEKVSMLGGPSMLDNLKEFNLSSMGKMPNVGRAPKMSQISAGSGGSSGASKQATQRAGVSRSYLVPDEQTMEMLLAQGDDSMMKYLRDRGFKPSWNS